MIDVLIKYNYGRKEKICIQKRSYNRPLIQSVFFLKNCHVIGTGNDV